MKKTTIQRLSKKRDEKKRTLKETENEKNHLLKKINRLNGKNCAESDVLKIQLQKKMRSIRRIKTDIKRIDEQIENIKLSAQPTYEPH